MTAGRLALLAALVTAGHAARADHVRLETERGPVHVFRPDGELTAVVVYVHGYETPVDVAYARHGLEAQFARSGVKAVFIVPEAPTRKGVAVVWPDLDELLAAVAAAAKAPLPDGPLVVAGHSGAYRTLAGWLGHPRLRDLILLDALYGEQEAFRAWAEDPAHRLAVVGHGTRAAGDDLVRGLAGARTLPRVPARLPAAARRARVLDLHAQMGHREIVTDGKVLPLLLRWAFRL